ncbi:MAG: replication restart helicase PriA [Planctomycetota bacterium]|jgi:primosomal protein N' (replication factor Y)
MPSLFPEADTAVAFARVAVERGVDRHPDGLTYAVPPALADLRRGERVVVPLGRGQTPTPGYVVEIETDSDLDPARIKPIRDRDPLTAPLPLELLDLAAWISRYYCAPIGMTVTSMLPAAVKRSVGTVTRLAVDAPEQEPDEIGRLSPQQRAVLAAVAALRPAERPIDMRALAERAGLRTTGPVRRLVDRGLLRAIPRTKVEAAWAEHATDASAPADLTEAQRRVIEAVHGTSGGFAVHLLAGVTGSGKTEVYIRLIERTIARGRVAVLLVPEIALTPQTGGRLIGRFPGRRVAVLHSGLTAAQRHQQWLLAARGDADIVLGARSAVFAPVPDGRLGLVVVDEEHDGSYKQDQAPRYHGRDVAVRRGQIAGCPVLLGSATPSLESWSNATTGRYHLHRLERRVPGLRLPDVRIVDLAAARRGPPGGPAWLSPPLEHAIGRTLDAGGQVLLLLNRRGYAHYIVCADQRCGWHLTCDDCDVTLVHHLSRRLPAGGFVRCHHCLGEQRLPAACPDCGGRLRTFGLGTQRVEEDLAARFPALAGDGGMQRVDSDTMRTAADFHDALGRFGRGELRLLVGTQMIAKGLDFPDLQLVGVINADTALHLPDFRATERTFQLVSQVAGRTGRGRAPGLVIVQTFDPESPAIRLAAAHDYRGFADAELADRRRCGLPPARRMTRIVVRDPDAARAATRGRQLADALRSLAPPGTEVLGPGPCPIARIAGRHRHQVELLAPDGSTMQRLLAAARDAALVRSSADMAVDVDPLTLM